MLGLRITRPLPGLLLMILDPSFRLCIVLCFADTMFCRLSVLLKDPHDLLAVHMISSFRASLRFAFDCILHG